MSGPSPIVIEFLTKGVPEVLRAIRSISDAVTKTERQSVAAAKKGASDRAKAAEKEAKDKVAAVTRGEAAVTAARRAGAKELEKKFKEEVRLATKAAAEQIRIAKQIAAEEKKARLEILAGKQAGVARFGPQARLAELGAIRKLSLEEQRKRLQDIQGMRAADAVHKELNRKQIDRERQLERQKQAIRERSASMAGRFAEKQARQEAQKREQFANTVMGAGGRAIRNTTFIAGAVAAGLGHTVTGLGGGFSIQDSLQERVSLERQAALLANKAPGGARPTQGVLQASLAASRRTGMDASQLMAAWGAYMDKTGDFAGGKENMEFFGRFAKATGSDIGQVATAAGMLRVQNKTLDPAAMKQLMLDVLSQGRTGAVDIPELAASVPAITKTSASFAGSQTDNQRRLIALSQIGVRTGSVSEAATAISNLSSDAQFHKAEVEAFMGKGYFNEKGQIAKAPEEFLADIIDKAHANPETIMRMGSDKKVFGNRSIRMFNALLPTYNQAEEAALKSGASKGDAKKAAKEAVLADMRQFTDAKYDEKELDKDFAEVMKSSAEQFEVAVRELKVAVGEQLLPELKNLIPVLKDLTPHLVKVLQAFTEMAAWAARNPIKATVLTLGASITKEVMAQVVSAKIGEVIKSLLVGGSTPVPKPPVPTPGAGAAAAAGVAVGAVVGNAMLGYSAGQEEAQDLRAKVDAWRRGDHERGVSPEAAQKVIDEAKGRLGKAGAFEQAGNIIASPFSDSADNKYKRFKGDQGLVESDEGKKLQELIAALNAAAAAAKQSGGSGGAAPANPASPMASNRTLPISRR